jgi:hypothetical protein
MACPFFVPQRIATDASWQHPSRLPLGAGWRGACCASGQEMAVPDAAGLELCNLGYAAACPHLPPQRDWDAIRFSVACTNSALVTLWYICEAGHAPRSHGKLSFDLERGMCLNPHPDARVQRLAQCYVETYRSRQTPALI